MSSSADLDIALPVLRDLGAHAAGARRAPGPLERRRDSRCAGADPRSLCDVPALASARSAEDEAIAMVIELCRKHRCPRPHRAPVQRVGAPAAARRAGTKACRSRPRPACTTWRSPPRRSPPARPSSSARRPSARPQNRELLWRGLRDGRSRSWWSRTTPPARRSSSGWAPATSSRPGAASARCSSGCRCCGRWRSERGHPRAAVPLERARAPARARRPRGPQGQLAPGYDADLVVWDDTRQLRGHSPTRSAPPPQAHALRAGARLRGVVQADLCARPARRTTRTSDWRLARRRPARSR